MADDTPSNTPPKTSGDKPAAQAPAAELTPNQSANLKLLMDREKTVRDAESGLKQQEETVRWAQELKSLKDSNPIAVLDQLGMSSDDLIKRVSEGQTTNELAQVRQQMAQMQADQHAAAAREAELRESAAKQDVINEIRRHVQSSDKFKALKASGLDHLVYDRIAAKHSADGTIPSYDDAASEVETELREFHSKLSNSLSDSNASNAQTPSATPPAPATLTNNHQTAPGSAEQDLASMTREQRLAIAVGMLKYDERE